MINFKEISEYLTNIKFDILWAYNEVHGGYYHIDGAVFLTGESLTVTFIPNTSGIGSRFNVPVEVLSSKNKMVKFFKEKEEERLEECAKIIARDRQIHDFAHKLGVSVTIQQPYYIR